MHARGGDHAELLDRLIHDALAFLDGECFESLVLQSSDGVTFVVIAHPPLERRVTAGRGIRKRAPIGVGIQRCRAERKQSHPPATGGMNTIVSPFATGVSQVANSSLIATFNCSGASLNG